MGKTEVRGSVEYTSTRVSEDPKNRNLKICAIWTIPDFMEILHEDKNIDQICSPFIEKFKFATTLYRSDNRVKIYYLSREKVLIKSVEVKTFSFDEDRWRFEEEQSIAKEDHLIVLAKTWQPLADLDIEEKKGLVIEDNTFVWLLENKSLYLKFEFVITNIKIKNRHDYNIPAPQLHDVLTNILRDGTHSDVVMKSADGQEFKVHKALLASRSEVLKANFEHNFTESVTNVVESPLESAVLQEMLLFIYTDRAKVDEMPEKLLAAADYYQLGRLKSLCEEALHKQLTIDNALDTLQLADLHSAHTLTQLTLDYIKQDYEQLKAILYKTEGWARLSNDLWKRIFE